MEIIKQGAEALLYLDVLDGQKVLVKDRIKKNYRISEIDDKLRKTRTKSEAKLITDARKCGVMTPQILDVDEKNFKITMEFIEGTRVKEFLSSSDVKDSEKICYEIGKDIGKMHTNDIIHGDLTTSNMILKNNRVYFIDFGLGSFSKRIENKAVDLNLLYEALRSTHFKILDACWKSVIRGYSEEFPKSEEVIKQIAEIERRGRYASKEIG